MRVLSLASLKGGIGKTSTAVNLGAVAASLGYRTVLFDLDPQGSATWCVGSDIAEDTAKKLTGGKKKRRNLVVRTNIPGLAISRADESLRNLSQRLADNRKPTAVLNKVRHELEPHHDLAIFDSPPGMDLLAENLARVSDMVLIPTEPVPLSVESHCSVY